MANSTDPDQLASKKQTDLDLHRLQRQNISGFSRIMVNTPTCGKIVRLLQLLEKYMVSTKVSEYFGEKLL